MSRRMCIVNLGLYRTGTTTLAETVSRCLPGSIARKFPDDLSKEQLRGMLVEPEATVREWWYGNQGKERVMALVESNDLICDGWIALLVFLPRGELEALVQASADTLNTYIHLVITTRDVESMVKSELHHWVINDLERKTGLSFHDRCNLEALLRARWLDHASRVDSLLKFYKARPDLKIEISQLPIEDVKSWPTVLAPLLALRQEIVQAAFEVAGAQNQNPPLPLQGVLLTLRIASSKARDGVDHLLLQLEKDRLCKYLVVIALDHDEADSTQAAAFLRELKEKHLVQIHLLRNPPLTAGPFPICHVWHSMAEKAWQEGASWVALLGDDVSVDCPFHYRAIYRSFLSLQEKFEMPQWFGCPWFNDVTFPGFPTFPIVGAEHYKIFGGLIPQHRMQGFCNQDLDPYIQRLYLKFGASAWMDSVCLTNQRGGTDSRQARYQRWPAVGWRDWVLEDVAPIEQHLKIHMKRNVPTKQILDVIVPTYRLNLEYLEHICSLSVPSGMRTTFIVIIDNPDLLVKTAASCGKAASRDEQLVRASQFIEEHLVSKSGNANNIRVRCNSTNKGASASRNRGIDESTAEYILFLDDDVYPESNLLEEYSRHLATVQSDPSIQGLVGLVQFPRSPYLAMKHAAVLMSYLTFMFEIAVNPAYQEPAWGVTANLLVKRTKLRFDTAYAKSGGGEDVDFCLRHLENCKGRFLSSPNAVVHHEFWKGSVFNLASHFFNWAIGDSALFARFPLHCYRSWPNLVETATISLLPWLLYFGLTAESLFHFAGLLLCFVAADVGVDMAQVGKFQHRRQLLRFERPLWFCVVSHVLANLNVIILETGRLLGHARRFQLLSHFAKRFDWHCGRLSHSQANFRRTELHKFVLFVALTVGWVSDRRRQMNE